MHLSVLYRAGLAIYLLGATLTGCNILRPTTRIVFVLPAGFRGPFVIVPAAGASPLRQAESVLYVDVPSNGVVKVPSLAPFERFTEKQAVFSDGSAIKYDLGVKDDPSVFVDDREVAVRCAGWRQAGTDGGRMEYFVGTLEDFHACDFSTIGTKPDH